MCNEVAASCGITVCYNMTSAMFSHLLAATCRVAPIRTRIRQLNHHLMDWVWCRQLMSAQEGEQPPLERLSALFHNFFRHTDFTSSDVAVTVYLANVLKRIERRNTVKSLMSAAAVAAHASEGGQTCSLAGASGRGGSGQGGSSSSVQDLLSHEDTSTGAERPSMHRKCHHVRCSSAFVTDLHRVSLITTFAHVLAVVILRAMVTLATP